MFFIYLGLQTAPNKGVSFEQIQEFTELSIQRIKELAQKFEKKKEDV